jgi:hypothetical protein
MPVSGGTNYAVRLVRRSGEAAKGDAEMDAGELLHEQVRLVFADFRAWFAESTNALKRGNLDMEGDYVPF